MGDGVNLSFSEAVYMLQHKREILSVFLGNFSMTGTQHKKHKQKETRYFLIRIITTFNWMAVCFTLI